MYNLQPRINLLGQFTLSGDVNHVNYTLHLQTISVLIKLNRKQQIRLIVKHCQLEGGGEGEVGDYFNLLVRHIIILVSFQLELSYCGCVNNSKC